LIQAIKSNQPNKMPRTIHKTIDQGTQQKQTTHPGANCKKCLAQFWFDNTLGIQLFFFARDLTLFRVTCGDLREKNLITENNHNSNYNYNYNCNSNYEKISLENFRATGDGHG